VPIQVDARAIAQPDSYRARILLGTGDLSQTPVPVDVALTVEPSSDLATVVGTVRDGFSGAPLTGAVQVNSQLRLTLDEEGSFHAMLQPGQLPYVFQTDVQGYVNQSERLLLESGNTYTLDFVLNGDMPILDLTRTLSPGSADPPIISDTLDYGEHRIYRIDVQNNGSQPLDFHATVPSEPYGIWRSDQPEGPDNYWINMPLDNTNPVTLTRYGSFGPVKLDNPFPFNGVLHEEVYISAKGLISFDELNYGIVQQQTCLPTSAVPHTAIAPLHADLNPEAGGKVHWAEVEEGFLISFEDVPISDQNSIHLEPDVTFQVLLAHDGRIVFNYGQLDNIPGRAAAGLQYSQEHAQIVGCGRNTPIASRLTIEFRPQVNSQQWLWLSGDTEASELQSGEQMTMEIHVRAASTRRYQPHRSAIVVTSNDPNRPLVHIPVQLTTASLPQHRIWLPLSATSP
jgi:hypothetical protein